MNSTIGRNIRRLRQHCGYSQQELAKRSRTSQTWICRIEIGDENPTLGSIKRIAHALDVQVVELLRERPEQVV
jgi:transcriptional regulator with XRE-family HTH domain